MGNFSKQLWPLHRSGIGQTNARILVRPLYRSSFDVTVNLTKCQNVILNSEFLDIFCLVIVVLLNTGLLLFKDFNIVSFKNTKNSIHDLTFP